MAIWQSNDEKPPFKVKDSDYGVSQSLVFQLAVTSWMQEPEGRSTKKRKLTGMLHGKFVPLNHVQKLCWRWK